MRFMGVLVKRRTNTLFADLFYLYIYLNILDSRTRIPIHLRHIVKHIIYVDSDRNSSFVGGRERHCEILLPNTNEEYVTVCICPGTSIHFYVLIS